MASSTSSNATFNICATFDKIKLEVTSGPNSSLMLLSKFFIWFTSVMFLLFSTIGFIAVVAVDPYLLLFGCGVVTKLSSCCTLFFLT